MALAGTLGCRGESTPAPERAAASPSASAGAAREVELVPVLSQELDLTVEISGTLAADERVTVGAKVPGRLASLEVDLASPVTRGQVLARIESTDYALRVQQAEAALAQAQAQLGVPIGANGAVDAEQTAVVRQARATANEAATNLKRARTLAAEGLMTGMQLDAAEAAAIRAETSVQAALEEVRLRQAAIGQRRSELGIARQQLADAVIRSPIEGVVQTRIGSTGEYVAAGAPIVEIVRVDPLRLRVGVPERDAAALRAGQAVEVRVDGDSTVYTGSLSRVSPALDLQSRTLLVEADIKNPGTLRPGSFANARIVVGSKPAPTIPRSALITFAGLTKVIVVAKDRALEKRVTIGRSAGDRVEIVSGVKVGESVVAKPGSLQQGQPVRVKPSSAGAR